MGLADLASVASLLMCPRCGSGLVRAGDTFRCSSPSCANNAPGAFPMVGRWPALVDFERSIVRRDQLASAPHGERRRWSIARLPPRLRRLWRPSNRVAARNVERLLRLLPGPSPLVLVIGGGTLGNGVGAIYRDRRARILGFDLYGSPLTQLIADAHQIPLAGETVDAVVVQAVLEHVLDPSRVVGEIRRVLKPGGLVYAETPFLQQVHAGPLDFVRYTSSGHRYLFRSFDEVAAGPVAGAGTQLLWSLDHLVRGLLRSELAGKLARALFSWLRHLDRLVGPAYAMDDASAYYFLGRRADRELSPREIVDYYRGAQRAEPAGKS
ncbi:MAG TPA: methyltransferase domain-containing protein [Solirubrobacteraceae bacterium]|jgi:ubiquinone/menaquinone biosynthesis C-methylase UbiE